MIYIVFLLITMMLIYGTLVESRKYISTAELNLEFYSNKELDKGIQEYAIEYVTKENNYKEFVSVENFLFNLERYVYIKLKQNIANYIIIFSMNNSELRSVIHTKLIYHQIEIDISFWKDYYVPNINV